ncbi:MAG TPA: metabolite traffic protein EboE [Agriterribacter sp.]|nr:metabolite traffic protein EboE [Agriterribacter sp.]
MQTVHGHLTYCSNIHAGESWDDHFKKLQENIPLIKSEVSPARPFGIGLRLSNEASLELIKENNLTIFKQWLKDNDCYVFTMNGFPYGGFHNLVVKDKVHAPDWTTTERVSYTIRLAHILTELLPEGMEGGISTSPLTYRFWHEDTNLPYIFNKATMHLLEVVDQLVQIKQSTGKNIHIDIEPEPDGLLGDGKEFLDWYTSYLLPLGTRQLAKLFGCSDVIAAFYIKEHIQLCYDICHFAVCYEDHAAIIQEIKKAGIKTGKIQISAALKAELPEDIEKRKPVIDAFTRFNEPTYLHQVVAMQKNGQLKRYADMPDALKESGSPFSIEWRAHFHVPLFIEGYGVLQSTQKDIEQVLAIHQEQPFTSHLEIETYTWEVLPDEKRLPITQSIIREMQWVIDLLGEDERDERTEEKSGR